MKTLDFAIRMEQEGKAFYEKLAAQTAHAGVKGIFAALARDEEKHREVLERWRGGGPGGMIDSTALEDARSVFSALSGGDVPVREVASDPEGYRFAMRLEAESFRLYEDAARDEVQPEARALLLRIAAEERKHFTILENVYAFVNAPSQYLAWGEFSNIEEFRNYGRPVDV